MKCYNCGRPAMFLVGEPEIPLCLDCNLKHAQVMAIQNEQLEREMNYLTDEMEAIAGVSVGLPKYPERKAVHVHGATFNNIRVTNSAVGMINTGTIETVDAAVTAINSSGQPELGKAIAVFCETVLADDNLDHATKNKLIEMMSMVSSEATAPKERRRSFAVRPVLKEMATLVGASAALATLWEKIKPLFDAAFS